MSSSSFGTVIGTPRDQIPKLPIGNYANTAPDLSKSVAERNQEHVEDLKDFFASVTDIENLRHNNTWDNISGLEQFTAAGAQLFQKREADKESRETIKRFKNINQEELQRLGGKLTDIMKLEKAERINQLQTLVRDGNETERKIALDLLNQNVLPTGEEIRFGDAKNKFNNVAVSTYNSVTEKNYLLSSSTLADAELIGDNAIRDILTDVYYELNLAGFDINSRQVQSYINRKLLPSLFKENKNQINSWKALRPQIVQANIKKENKADILDTFTRKAQVTEVNDQGVEETSIKNTGDFNNLLEVFIARNPTVENKADAINFIMELLDKDPSLKDQIKLGDIDYFLNDAEIIDDTQNGKVVNGFLNTKAKGVESVEKFFMSYKTDIADTNSEVFSDIKKEMSTIVRDYLAENNRDRLLPGEQLHFITQYNNKLRARGLSTNLPIPGFLKGDETIEDRWSYDNHVAAVGSINKRDWENAYRSQTQNKELPLTINTQIEKAKAELTRQVLEAKAKDDNANIDDLVEQLYPAVLKDLVEEKFVSKQDKLRPLLPEDTEKEISSLKLNTDKWLNNKEVNSIYEKRYIDQYIEDYMGKGFLPSNIPTYIKKLADAAGMTPHQYIMTRVTAMNVYDAKTMKFVSDKNPEDIFNLNEEEKKYLFIKPMSSKNVLLFSKDGGLNSEKTKSALLALRQKGRNVDSYEGRGFLKKIGAFFGPGPQNITVQDAYNLAKSGEGTNFGLYGISAKDMIRLVDAGILDPNATFDENTQDFAALGLMYLQANDGNSIMGAQTEALDWRYLAGLDEATQAQVLIFFPNLRDMPMNQFHNLQGDVSKAILNEVEQKRLFSPKSPQSEEFFATFLSEDISEKERLVQLKDNEQRLINKIGTAQPGDGKEKDGELIPIRQFFQKRIEQGLPVSEEIRRVLQGTRNFYQEKDVFGLPNILLGNELGYTDNFDYFKNFKRKE